MNNHLSPIGTVISDLSQQILYADDRFCEIVGRDQTTLIGQLALSFTYTDDLPTNQPSLDKVAAGGHGFTIVKRYVRGDGEIVWVRNHVTKIMDGHGSPILCATTQQIERPFGSERLARNYEAAQRLCFLLISGRRQLTPQVIWGPGIEALLWLYCAELDGRILTADELAARTGSAPKVMTRWITFLQERHLVVTEALGSLSEQTWVRISAKGERALDGLLAKLSD